MRSPSRLLVLALVAALLVTGGAVALGTIATGDDQSSPPDDDPFLTTELDDFDVRGLAVRRASFCASIDPRQVAAALGADPESERTWDNGERVEVSEGVRDVVHEHGCEYVAGNTSARGWVFAPPITQRRARQLLKGFVSPTCAGLPESRYGDPSVIASCDRQGGVTSIFAGRFGDAWLTCQLETQGPVDELEFAQRSARWCVSLAIAAAEPPVDVG